VISHSTIQGWLHSISPDFLLKIKDQVMASPIGARLARGTFWSLVAGCVSRSLALVASIVIARLLGKETFGQLGILQSTLEMFGTFAAFGMGLASTKYVAECRKSDPDKAGRIVAMSSVVAWVTGGTGTIVLIFCSPWLADKVLAAPQLAQLLQMSSISLLFGAVNGAQVGGLAGFEAFKQLAKINLVSGVLTIILRVGGTMVMGLKGAVYGMVIAQMVGCVINFVVLRRLAAKSGIVVRYSHCLQDLPVIWKFSLPAVLSSFLVMPTSWLCYTMLFNRPNGAGEMAVFNAANQWFYVILFIPGLMGEAALPILFDRMSHRDYKSAHKIFLTSVKLNALLILPLVIFGLFSRQVMGLYGKGFGGGWETMVIVLATAGLQAIQMPAGYMLVSTGRMWLAFTMALGWSVSFVCVTALLVTHGSSGLASARFIALGLHCVWTFAFVFHALKAGRKLENEPPRNDADGQRKMLTTLEEQRAIIKAEEMLD
jgi:O-antigen/teichoic acid export membrane protein